MGKRFLAILLALTMVLSLLPAAVLAEGGTPALTQHTDAGHRCHHCAADATQAWTAWNGTSAAFQTVADGQVAHYVLSADATLDTTVSLTAGTYVLCLNGRTLQVASGKSFFRLSGTATLIIEDCTAAGDPTEAGYTAGKLKGATATAIVASEAASLAIYAGIFEDNDAGAAASGGAISIIGGTEAGGTLTVDGALFKNNNAKYGAAIYIKNYTVTALLKNTMVTENSTRSTGAVFVESVDTVTIQDTTITGNTCTSTNADFTAGLYVTGGKTKVIVTGKVVIDGNSNSSNNKNRNVSLYHSNSKLTIEGLTEGTRIQFGSKVNGSKPLENSLVLGQQTTWNCSWLTFDTDPVSAKDTNGDGKMDTLQKGHYHDDQQEALQPWTKTTTLPTSGSWYLTKDVTLANNTTLSKNTLNLCLNGHTVKVEKEGTTGARIFKIQSNVTLNLTDCAEVQGKLTGGKASAIIFESSCENAVLNMYGGEITGNTANDAGAGIILQGKGVFNMYGGKITGNKVEGFIKADGTPNNTILSGGGVAVLTRNSVFNMYGGEISGNEVKAVTYKKDGVNTTVGGNGAAVYAQSGAVNIYGGTLCDNIAQVSGGAVYAKNTTLTIKDAVLQGNNGGREGGAVRLNAVKATLSNVTMTENVAQFVGALYLSGKSEVILDSCTVTGNEAKSYGAVYVPNATNKLTLKGNVQIIDNKRGNEQQNVYLLNAKNQQPMLQVEGLADTAVIGVTVTEDRLFENVLQVAVRNENEDCVACFVSDHSAYTFAQRGTGIYVKQGHAHCVCGDATCRQHDRLEMLPWTKTTTLPTGGSWYLTEDVTLANNATLSNATLNLCLNGHTVKVEKEGTTGARIFKIQSNVTLNLTDCAQVQGKLTGGKTSAILFEGACDNAVLNLYGGELTGNSSQEGGGAILLQGKCIVNLYGGKIHDNTVQPVVKVDASNAPILDENGNQQLVGKFGYGAGISIFGTDAVLNMYGGEICGNTAKTVEYTANGKQTTGGGDGGGVYVRGTFNMYGGKISGNTGNRNAGGVYLSGGKAVLTMSGGEISGNTAGAAGGGIVVESRATMNLKNGKITGNKTLKNNGAGVYVSTGCVMNMTGGEISGNRSANHAGGVIFSKSTGELTGGTISNNAATVNGGGLYVTGETAKVTLDGVAITGNQAKNGGGIILESKSNLHLKSGKITSNKAVSSGGGICASVNTTATMEGGSISYNTAQSNAGGMYIVAAKVKMTNVTVQGNVAKGNAGAILLSRKSQVQNGVKIWILSTLTMNGCYVANNEGTHAGAVLVEGEGDTLNIYGGTFQNNKAKGDGGAIYASSKTILNLHNAKIIGNEAAKRGGGLRVANYVTLAVKGTTFTQNTAGNGGGAVFQNNAAGTYDEITVTDNVSKESGGGISIQGYSPNKSDIQTECTFNNSTFSGNEASYYGGGLAGLGFANLYVDDCRFEKNQAKNGAGIYGDAGSAIHVTNSTVAQNSATGIGGGLYTSCLLIVKDSQVTDNTAGGNGGGIVANNCRRPQLFMQDTGVKMTNTVVSGNQTDGSGGGMYLPKGCAATLTDVTVTGNVAKDGVSGFLSGYDLTVKNLTVTGNRGTEYAVWITEPNYDGHSYQVGHRELSGVIKISDNEGGDLFAAEGAVMTFPGEGLAAGSEVHITLASGLITQRVFGLYDYEGGDLVYTLTPGTRSVTEPEIAVAESEDIPVSAKDDTMLYIGVVVFVILIVAAAVIVLLVKKKKAAQTADRAGE